MRLKPPAASGGSVRFKRLMRPKPPRRGLLSLRLGTRRWKAVHARSRCGGLFRGLGFFPLGKLLAHCRADHIRIDAVLFAASTRTLLPPGPNPLSRGAVSKKYAKSAISAISALFIFRRFFVFPTDSLILFLFVLSDGRPDDYYGFCDCVRGRSFVEEMLWWPPFLCAESAVSDLSYFLLLATQQRIVTFGPPQDCAASRQHFDGAFTCIRFIFFVVRCNQNVDFRGQTELTLKQTSCPPDQLPAVRVLQRAPQDIHFPRDREHQSSLARSNAKCTAAWPRRSADDPEGPPKRKGSARWCSIRSKLSSGNADRYVCFRVTSAVCRR
jgi:hypothetical protein